MRSQVNKPGSLPVQGAGESASHRAGYVVLAGRPNVGKSTLLNKILGQKIAIVTPKPQTTRRRLLGIKTLPGAQILFVDTPGIHHARDLMNRRMVEQAKGALRDADVALWITDGRGSARQDDQVAARLAAGECKVVAVLNKIDCFSRDALLPRLEGLARLLPEAEEIVPVSARTGKNVDELVAVISRLLPVGPRYYPEDEITDAAEREIVAELIREKITLETRDEVPYATAVTVDSFTEHPERGLVVIGATVHVERTSQKMIVVGRGGKRLKEIGTAARKEIETLLSRRVYLELFVRVQADWTTKNARLEEFGL